jgi:glycosyltransferase involved in cell wall biosynthesis
MKNTSRIKIAYYSKNDPLDKRSWSGTTYYLGQALQKHIGDVDFLGPVRFPWIVDKMVRGMVKFCRIFLKSNYLAKYGLLQNFYSVRYLKRKMKGRDYDFIVAPAAAPELGLFKTKIPIVYFGDSTYKCYSDSYEKEFKDLDRFSRWEGNYLEKLALKKSSFFVFSSDWAARSAIEDYGVPADKIIVWPLGANMDDIPHRDTIFKKEENRILTLLFLAVDWDRKGGKIAFEAFRILRDQYQVPTKLIVCGCIPPPGFEHSDMEVIPFLDKNKKEDYRHLVELLASSHFLLLPTRADCNLLVACEANAYGVPAITTDTCGVPAVVVDGINGYCLPLQAGGADYANLIREIFTDKDRYHRLVQSSRQRFEDELNWDRWAEKFSAVFRDYLPLPEKATASEAELQKAHA